MVDPCREAAAVEVADLMEAAEAIDQEGVVAETDTVVVAVDMVGDMEAAVAATSVVRTVIWLGSIPKAASVVVELVITMGSWIFLFHYRVCCFVLHNRAYSFLLFKLETNFLLLPRNILLLFRIFVLLYPLLLAFHSLLFSTHFLRWTAKTQYST
ncbi:hypothetical protein PHJA_001489600 [Phtheirospermum japonicum]|uniref:Uncharacterized protein n=1 Tax=Phtheirospermum japonicum TaxID=374723 RepID=A0A830C5K6_9LAMI|nr:hypothetical protein PHJA_001489600 [Phtheirospermum japonicum]